MRHVGRLELFVHPSARRRGVGDALVGEAVRRARTDPRLRKLSLAVFADNAAALALYRKHGFLEEGHRIGEYLMEDGTLRDDLLLWRPV
jgi:putative acetyltransferase